MSEDNKAWILVNPENGKEAEVWSAAFHEDKWLNTWRHERKKEALDTQALFKREKELAPPQRSFGDLLHSHHLSERKNQRMILRTSLV